MKTPAARRLVPALAVLALSALTAACGGGGGSSSATTTSGSAPASTSSTTGAAGARTAFAAYRTCLSQHGVKLPTGGFGRRPTGTTGGGGTPPAGGGFGGGFGGGARRLPPGVNAATYQKAQQACASKRPTGGFGFGGRGGGRQVSSSALAAFRSCLQSHGVKLTTQGGFQSAFGDPKARKALQTCRVLLPQRPTGTTGTTTGQ